MAELERPPLTPHAPRLAGAPVPRAGRARRRRLGDRTSIVTRLVAPSVAAIGKLLNRTLDPLFAEWAADEYPADMAAEKATLVELTGVYQRAVDALKAQPERDKVDYYACDLVDAAVWLTCSWLLLRDTNLLESKKSIARSYIASIAPRLRAAAGIVTESNAVPLEAIGALL